MLDLEAHKSLWEFKTKIFALPLMLFYVIYFLCGGKWQSRNFTEVFLLPLIIMFIILFVMGYNMDHGFGHLYHIIPLVLLIIYFNIGMIKYKESSSLILLIIYAVFIYFYFGIGNIEKDKYVDNFIKKTYWYCLLFSFLLYLVTRNFFDALIFFVCTISLSFMYLIH